jgi:hypothetical protein
MAEHWLEEGDEKYLADDGKPSDPSCPSSSHLAPRLGVLHDHGEVGYMRCEIVGHDISAVAGTGQQHHPAAVVERTGGGGLRPRRIR